MGTDKLPLANVITLGVLDLARQREFYQRLGWPQVADLDDFVAFELRGTVLALFPVEKLAIDGNTEAEPGRGGIRFSIIITAETADEVDELADAFRKAGARITKEPQDAEFFSGRSCYLADPEGNYFEIAWSGADNSVTAAAYRAAGLPRPD